MELSEDIDLKSGIAISSSNTPSIHTLLKEFLAILACADNPTPAGRAASFVSVGGGGTGKVQVEFEIICRRLRQHVLEAVARERYGDGAVRIIRVLLTMDKMDEKHVCSPQLFWLTSPSSSRKPSSQK
jgi:DNA-directed RNA polymerase III subunit RPC3